MRPMLSNVIAAEKPQRCSDCGRVVETRPYGKDGAEVCYRCGMKPANKEHLNRAMNERFGGGSDVQG